MRAIHVADYYDDRIYFLVDKEDDHDGAILRPSREPILIDLFSYMGRVSGDKGWKQITNTKFHDFLWHGQNGELANRWRRVFQEHSIEPRKELLLSVPVVTDFPEHQKRKKASEKRSNRASEFKSLLAAGLHEKALGRRIGRGARRLARGGSFDADAIDADLDMIVQEGTPWERPALPSMPDSPRRMARRARQQGLQSHRDGGDVPTRGWFTQDGKGWRDFHRDPDRYVDISPKESRQILDAEHRAVEKAYSNGEPIRTRGELGAALEKAHPGFADGSSEFDATGKIRLARRPTNPSQVLAAEQQNDNAELDPVEREVAYALLEHLRLNPNLQDANLQVHSFRTRDELELLQPGAATSADGWALYETGALFDFDQNGELVLVEDEKPTIEIGYKADTPLAENDHRRNDPDKKSPMADRMEDGKRYWDSSLDAPFSPRADPKQSGSGAMDMMARRIYMSFMAELDEPHMTDSDQGWELDPTDNWHSPHTTQGVIDPRTGAHVGRPRATRRKRKVKKQHEEAVRHAAANIAHHEFSHADHYMAMRKDLIAAVKEHVGEGGTTLEGLEKFIREQLVSHMTDRQRRRALETVVSERLARMVPKYVAHLNALKTTSLLGMASPETLAGPNTPQSMLQDIQRHSRESLEGLIEHLEQPILGADGEPILITDDVADFLNSHPALTSSSLVGAGEPHSILDFDPEDLEPTSDRDPRTVKPVSAGEPLTRQHLLNVFGSEHAYLNDGGVPFSGLDAGGAPQRTPVWALTMMHDIPGQRGKYGGSFVQPMSGRDLVNLEQHPVSPSSPSGAAPINHFTYATDAFEILLEHGTPEIQMHGVWTSQPDSDLNEGAIIPALSPEGARVLVDALARATGQIPRSWYKENLLTGGKPPGRTLADIPPDTTPKLGKGRNVLPYLDEDLPATEVTEALQELVEHWMRKITETGQSGDVGKKNMNTYLDLVGRAAFHFDDLNDAEIDGMMDLIEDIGIESTLSGGRTVRWAPYMGWVDQRPRMAPGMTPLINGMNARHHEFFAELGAALSSGLTIRPPVNSVQHTALKKVTAWLRRNQPFTAKVNIDRSRISRIHLPRDQYLRREELLRQSLEMERLARNTTKQEPHG